MVCGSLAHMCNTWHWPCLSSDCILNLWHTLQQHELCFTVEYLLALYIFQHFLEAHSLKCEWHCSDLHQRSKKKKKVDAKLCQYHMLHVHDCVCSVLYIGALKLKALGWVGEVKLLWEMWHLWDMTWQRWYLVYIISWMVCRELILWDLFKEHKGTCIQLS